MQIDLLIPIASLHNLSQALYAAVVLALAPQGAVTVFLIFHNRARRRQGLDPDGELADTLRYWAFWVGIGIVALVLTVKGTVN